MFTPIVKSNYHLYNAKVNVSPPQKGLKGSGKKIHSSPQLSGMMQSSDALASARTTASLNQLYTTKNRPRAKVANPQLRTISEGPERPQPNSMPRRCASVDDSGKQSNSSDSSMDSVAKATRNEESTASKNPFAQLIRSIRRLSASKSRSSRHSSEETDSHTVGTLSSSPTNDQRLQPTTVTPTM